MSPRVSTLSTVGATAIVLTRSAATRISRPSSRVPPSARRRTAYTCPAGPDRRQLSPASRKDHSVPAARTKTPRPSNACATCSMTSAKVTAGTRPRGRSAHGTGGIPDGPVDVFRVYVQLLGGVLLRLQGGLIQGLLDVAFPDHHQGGLPVIDDLPEFLDVGTGHAAPQVAADPTHGRAHYGCADDGGREEETDRRPGGRATPGTVPCGHLILIDVHLALVVLGHHGGVVAPNRPGRVQLFDHPVVLAGLSLTWIGTDVDEDRFRLCHGLSPDQADVSWTQGAVPAARAHHPLGGISRPGGLTRAAPPGV